MDNLDRYLNREYRDPDYRRGLLASQGGRSPLRNLWHRMFGPRRRGPVSDQTVVLSRLHVWAWDVTTSPTVTCLAGSLWLTRKGDRRDYFLGACESLALVPGKWVIQALTLSRFRMRTPQTSQEACHDEAPVLSLLQRV